jgi:hypothetical protein
VTGIASGVIHLTLADEKRSASDHRLVWADLKLA